MSDDEQQPPILPEDEQKRLALRVMLEAWDDAVAQGASSEIVASSAIFAALTDMIDIYGDEMVAEWPDRIREGEFTLKPQGE